MDFHPAKLLSNATIPTISTTESGGFDLYAATDFIVRTHQELILPLNIQLCIPKGFVGLVRSRSGLAFKHKLDIN